MGRWVAKNVVAAGLATRCEIQFAYAIGYPDPVSMNINTFGTNTVPEEAIERAVNRTFSFKPADIIQQLDLLRPIYSKTTNYGHFGKDDPDITWEKTDKAKRAEKSSAIGFRIQISDFRWHSIVRRSEVWRVVAARLAVVTFSRRLRAAEISRCRTQSSTCRAFDPFKRRRRLRAQSVTKEFVRIFEYREGLVRRTSDPAIHRRASSNS